MWYFNHAPRQIVANGGTSQYDITKYDGACKGIEEKTYNVGHAKLSTLIKQQGECFTLF